MIGIIVATHGRLATELVATAELILGPLPRVAGFNVSPALSPQAMEEELLRIVSELDEGDGVLVLADLLGGTPCTRSLALCQRARLEVVTGVSLPMLLKACALRSSRSLRELAQHVVESGRSAIRWVTEALTNR
jgi:PTS system mannose-specific IIA component